MTVFTLVLLHLVIGLIDMNLRQISFQAGEPGYGAKVTVTAFVIGCAALWPMRAVASVWRHL